MLKIAVITQYFPTREQRWRGHSAYQTLRELAKHASIEVFFPHASYPASLRPKSRIYDSLDSSFSPVDVKAHYINYPALPGLSRPVNGSIAARRLFPHVSEFNPDIILSYVVYPDGYAALQVAKKLGVPVVLTAIGSDLSRSGGPIPQLLTRRALHKADFVITVSHDLLETAIRKGSNPATSRAVLNGCDFSIFHPIDRGAARQRLQIKPHAEMLLYIGRLDLRKGLMELVEAAVRLRWNRPRLCVYMVGDGPDKAALQSSIVKRGAGGYVMLLPACLTDEVPRWMAAADVVTLPSYKEGCPNVVLEALAMGRPVVATRVGGIPEIMSDDCGRLIPPADVSSLTDALNAVLETSWDESAIASRCDRSWKVVADEVGEVCAQLSSSRGATTSRRYKRPSHLSRRPGYQVKHSD
jgi:teichuronic acid biosynthesis glycosyltransferase TuaC